jgi:hypothetical protein
MNLDRIKQRLNQLSDANKPSGSKLIWKPKPGSQVVRIVPYVHNRDWPFLELYFYYDLSNRTIISPQNFGKPDPVQELANKLKSTGDREDWMLGRKLEPSLRTYVPIIVRGEEHEGVKFWGFGKTVYEELLKTIDDPDYGDITDLKTGTDITVEYEKPAEGYPKTSFRVKRNSSPATTDKEVIDLIKNMPTVEDIWSCPSYDELATILDNFINNKDLNESEEESPTSLETSVKKSNKSAITSDEDEDEDPFESASAALSAKKSAAAVSTDIDAAFDEMFG